MGSSKEGKIRSAPAYTITGREKPPLIPVMIFPGPGYYDGEYTVVKPKPPVFSMRGKYKMGSEDSKPGPGAHCPEKVSQISSLRPERVRKIIEIQKQICPVLKVFLVGKGNVPFVGHKSMQIDFTSS